MSDLSLQLQQAASQLPVSSYFDEALFRREMDTIFQRGPRYVGHQLSVPNPGDYYALPQEGEGRALLRTPRRRGADLQRLPPPPGRDPQGPRLAAARPHPPAATSCARCTAGPTAAATAARPARCWARRISPQDPCLNLNNYPLQEWNGLLFERAPAAPTSRPTWPAWARAPTSISPAWCSTAWRCTSATTTGRPSSRSTWRTTTSARSIRAWAAWSPATTCAGSSRRTIRCRPWASPTAWARPAARCTSAGRTRCCSTARASSPSTARSGSPTTRTSWWSGTRTCSPSPRCTRSVRRRP